MIINIDNETKERIASGDMEALKKVLTKFRTENIEHLTHHEGDVSRYQGAGQLVSALLDIFQLKVCLKKD
jgi:hypothetical protein